MNKNKLILIILSLISTFLLGALIYGVILVRSENQIISSLSNEVDNSAVKEQLASSIRYSKNFYSKDISVIESLTLNNDKLVSFIDSIETLAKTKGLKVEIASVTPEKSEKDKEAYPIKVHIVVETDGEWSKSIGFISALENLPAGIFIDNASLSVKEAPATETKISKNTIPNWHTITGFNIYLFK